MRPFARREGVPGSIRLCAAVAGFAGALTIATATAQAAPTLVMQRLPPGVSQLFDIVCPSAAVCFAVGGDQKSSAVIVTTTDAGATWTAQHLSGSLALFGVACTSTVACVAVGEGTTTENGGAFTTRNGRTWTERAVPAGAQLLQAVTCPSATDCLAGGGSLISPTLIRSLDAGVTWSDVPTPLTSGVSGVDCPDTTHCWAAGSLGGLYFSADFGDSWQQREPTQDQVLPADCAQPPGSSSFGAGDCVPFYDGVDFSSADDGWLIAEGGGLGKGPSVRTSRVFHTTDGGLQWRRWTPPSSFPLQATLPGHEVTGLACAVAACIGVAQVVDGNTGAATSSEVIATTDGQTWRVIGESSAALTAIACPTATECFASGFSAEQGVILGGLVPGPPSAKSLLSSVGGSLVTPGSLIAAPLNAVVNALITVGLILLITFPSQLFNRTYEENHARIRAWWAQRFGWLSALPAAGSRLRPGLRTTVSAAVVLLVGGILAAMLDPGFGVNVRSLALFIGASLALVAGATVTALAAGVYRLARHRVGAWHVHALPSALLVAAGCVLVSRLTDFQPGYLYGLIGGVVFSGQLSRREEGHEVAVASVATLVVSITAWLLWVPVSSAAAADPSSFGLALFENFLTALFLSGMVGLLIGLIPLRFLPGERLAQWHWGAWTVLFGVIVLTVVEVILRPQNNAARHASAPFWTTLGLFLAFGAASLLFWAYFKIRDQPVPATVGD